MGDDEILPGARSLLKDRSLLIRCECGCGDLDVTWWDDIEMLGVEIHQKERDDRTFRDRLRSAWHVLLHGHQDRADVMLSRETTWLLMEYLDERSTRDDGAFDGPPEVDGDEQILGALHDGSSGTPEYVHGDGEHPLADPGVRSLLDQ